MSTTVAPAMGRCWGSWTMPWTWPKTVARPRFEPGENRQIGIRARKRMRFCAWKKFPPRHKSDGRASDGLRMAFCRERLPGRKAIGALKEAGGAARSESAWKAEGRCTGETCQSHSDSGQTEVYALRRAGRDGNRGDGAECLPERTGYLAQRGARIWRCERRRPHHTGMSPWSSAADRQE